MQELYEKKIPFAFTGHFRQQAKGIGKKKLIFYILIQETLDTLLGRLFKLLRIKLDM